MTFVKSIVKIRRSERFTSRKPIRHGRASIFVIRAPDDEADIALKLGNWGAKLMQKTLRASLIVFQLGIITITMCLLLLIVSFLGSKPSSSDEERLEPFFGHRLTP